MLANDDSKFLEFLRYPHIINSSVACLYNTKQAGQLFRSKFAGISNEAILISCSVLISKWWCCATRLTKLILKNLGS